MIVYLFVVIQIYSSSAVFFYLIVKLSLEKSDEPKLIRQLPKKQQQVMLLRDVEGFDYQEIEKLTGQKVVHIRVLLNRARKQIRQQLKEMMQNGK